MLHSVKKGNERTDKIFKEENDMKDPRKKNKHKLSYAVKNNLYLLRLASKASRKRVVWEFVNEACGYVSWVTAIVLLQYLVDGVEQKWDFKIVAAIVLGSALLLFLCGGVERYCEKIAFPVGNQVLYENLHLKMFEKALDVELACYENPEFYNQYTKAASQIKGKAFSVINMIPELFVSMIAMMFLMIKIVSIDAFSVCFALIPIFSTYILGKRINCLKYDLYQESVEAERKRSYVSRTVYLRDYAKEIRLSNIFDVLMRYFRDAMQEIYDLYKKYGLKIELIAGLQGLFTQIIIFVGSIVYAAVRFLYFKDITAGEFVVLISIIDSLAVMIRGNSNTISKIHDNSLYIENVKSFLEYEPEISESQPGLAPTGEPLSLRFKNVSFSYFGQDKPVLKSISMHIEEKEKIALVGHNGAGKSTLVKLLMRLYDVTEGEIALNGHNIKEYAVRDYRELFATVFQDFKLLSASVAENVLMREVIDEQGEIPPEDREKVIAALKNSGVYERIMQLEKGIETTLSREFDEKGAVLSGGEGQKVAIARVFAQDSRIAILDEPSSALDPIAEYQMYDAMLKACEDKAVVFISHRLSSAVLADRIYMLENGRIVEEGSHEELMKRNGKYAEMFRMQAENYA